MYHQDRWVVRMDSTLLMHHQDRWVGRKDGTLLMYHQDRCVGRKDRWFGRKIVGFKYPKDVFSIIHTETVKAATIHRARKD